MTTNTPLSQRIAEVVQAMAREAGFAVEIKLTEFATSLDMADKGEFDAYAIGWSGRPDPDGNLFRIVGCNQSLNVSGYCNREVDALLLQSRSTQEAAKRTELYGRIAAIVLKDRPIIYLYHPNVLWAYTNRLRGLRPIPDGLVRVRGLRLE